MVVKVLHHHLQASLRASWGVVVYSKVRGDAAFLCTGRIFHSEGGRDRDGGEGRSHTMAPSPICPFSSSPTPAVFSSCWARASVPCERLRCKRVTVGPYSPLPISNSRKVLVVLTRHLQSSLITCRARASVLYERLRCKRVTVGPYSPLPISNS